MRITLQIVASHIKQPIHCIALSIESQRYFFNIPEAFQRFFREHSLKFTKGNKIFLSQLSSDHTAGMFGFVLTLDAQGSAEGAQIFGPPGLCQYLDSTRFLMGHRLVSYSIYDFFNNQRKLLGVKDSKFTEEVSQRKDYAQIFFKMNDFLLKEQEKEQEQRQNSKDKQKPGSGKFNDVQEFVREEVYKDEYLEIHPVLLTGDSNDESGKAALCYILKPDKIPGKVNGEKLKAHNIPAKSISKLLQDGQIEINGVIHKAEEFKDPDCPSPVVILIDCPSQAHFVSLLEQEKIKSLYAERINEKEEELKVIVHTVPTDVLLHPKYQDFLKSFSKSCQHIFLNEDIKPQDIEISAEKGKSNQDKQKKGKGTETVVDSKQMKYRHFMVNNIMAKYFPDHFPVLDDLAPNARYSLDELFPFLANKTTYPRMFEFVLAPPKNEGFSAIKSSMDKANKLLNFVEPKEFSKQYKKWLAIPKEPSTEVQAMFKSCDPELLFLGTQSMMPSIDCNVSGIYLRFWQQENTGILLDCGEGSYMQLLQHYGPEKTRELVKNIGVLYITHIHADHHFGLLQLIKERDRALREDKVQNKDPLYLVLPFNCGAWVDKFSKMVDKLSYKVVFCQHIKIESSHIHADANIQQGTTTTVVNEHHEETKVDEHGNQETVPADEEFEYYEAPDMKEYLLQEEKESKTNIPLLEEFLFKKLGIVKLKSVDVDHCPQSYGVYIEHKDGWKFVYTGDTRPCQTMVQEVGTSTILVHEATFGEDLQDQAIQKMHSTDKEAVEIGMKLKAWRTVLTHFSQRYAGKVLNKAEKIKVKDDYYQYCKHNVVKAYDHFRSRFSQLENMPRVSKCLANLFDE